jgi:hypothetical protein
MDAWPEVFEQLFPGVVPRIVRRYCLYPLKRHAIRSFQLADRISAAGSRYLQLARQHAPSTPTHLCYHGIYSDSGGADDPAEQGNPPEVRLLHLGFSA